MAQALEDAIGRKYDPRGLKLALQAHSAASAIADGAAAARSRASMRLAQVRELSMSTPFLHLSPLSPPAPAPFTDCRVNNRDLN